MDQPDGIGSGGRFHLVTRRLEGWALAASLALAGAAIGFACSEYRLHQAIISMRETQQQGIRRLTIGGCEVLKCLALPNLPAKADFNTMGQCATTVATLYGLRAGGANQ